jgi:hypothetical protein
MKYPLILCLLACWHFTAAQNHHEFKTDLLMPLKNGWHISYELIPASGVGLELDVRQLNDTYWSIGRFIPGCPTCPADNTNGKAQILSLGLNFKYYFKPQSVGKGLFCGIYGRWDYLETELPDIISTIYLSNYNANISPRLAASRQLRRALGYVVGFKSIVASRVVLEGSLGMDGNFFGRGEFDEVEFLPLLALKVGYRL